MRRGKDLGTLGRRTLKEAREIELGQPPTKIGIVGMKDQ